MLRRTEVCRISSHSRLPWGVRSLAIVSIVTWGLSNTGRCDVVPPPPAAATSLDEELLNELSLELPTDPATNDRTTRGAPSADRNVSPGEKGELSGEDIGEGSDPLERIGNKMRTVEQRMKARDTSLGTRRMQQEILRELEALIAQCQQDQAKSKSRAGQPGASPSEAAAVSSNASAATVNNDRRPTTAGPSAGPGSAGEGEKESWGNLPPRLREAMVRAGVDQFLPKYQQLIEDYFRSLAKEPPQ